jgi:hypothetical protein
VSRFLVISRYHGLPRVSPVYPQKKTSAVDAVASAKGQFGKSPLHSGRRDVASSARCDAVGNDRLICRDVVRGHMLDCDLLLAPAPVVANLSVSSTTVRAALSASCRPPFLPKLRSAGCRYKV